MAERKSLTASNQSTILRRSSRLSHYNGTAEPPEPTTAKRSEDPIPYNSSSPKTRVNSTDPSPSPARGTLLKKTTDFQGKLSKKKGESLTQSRNLSNGITGLERTTRVENGDDGLRTPRRSPRLADIRQANDEKKCYPDSVMKKSRQSCNKISGKANLSSGSRINARLNLCVDEVQGRRRSKRFQGLREVDVNAGNETSTTFNSLCKENSTEKSNSNVACQAKRNEKTSCKTLTTTNKTVKRVCVLALKAEVEGSNKGGDGVERKVVGVKRNRKQRQTEDRPMEGWTKEQEFTLKRAYLVAKPTPHFWKKVAKMVPGKSAQECFDRIHMDFPTPPQTHPQSRAAKVNPSLPKHLSLSASKLLKKAISCKRKNRLSHKTIRHLLQSRHKACQDNGADLFSIFEPNADLAVNAFQSSAVFSTPTQLKEKQGLQKFSQKSSSGHKKPLARPSSSCVTDIVSPPVLKQVKNKVLHEKFLDQLHKREARRKAASAQEAIPVMGQLKRDGRSPQKVDVLQAAKLALVSKARNAISMFQYSQANLMSDEYSFDNDDGCSIEDDDNEDEEEDGRQ